MARTLIFLQEQGIGTYAELNEKNSIMDKGHNGRHAHIKEIEARQKEI